MGIEVFDVNKHLYLALDQDGVLTALFQTIHREAGVDLSVMDLPARERYWKEDFQVKYFEIAPPLPDMQRLVKFSVDNFSNLRILTALPYFRQDQSFESIMLKIAWAKRHIAHPIPVTFGPTPRDKHLHCHGPEWVLVDDTEENIIDWNAAGGHGILHTSVDESIEGLKKIIIDTGGVIY
jgi:hypothetical protein